MRRSQPSSGVALGAACALVALAGAPGARAADLPLAPEPIDHVRVCDAFGLGFYVIPGTDTCVRISARARVDYNVFDYDPLFAESFGANGTFSRAANAYRMLARTNVYFDSRTATAFGLLRTYADLDFRYVTPAFGAAPATGVFVLGSAYVTLGGFQFGRAQSRYDFVDGFFAPGQAFLSAGSDLTTNLAAYTARFGDGLSVSLSLEDDAARRYGLAANAAFQGGYAGARFPDPVANLRVEADWGSAQVMGALHDVRARFVSDSALAFAVGGGVVANLPVGRATSAGVQATFTRGALQYASSTIAGGRRLGGTFYGPNDAIIDANGDLELSDGFGALAGFSTGLFGNTSLGVEAGYVLVDQAETDLDGDGTPDDLDFQSFAVDGSLGYSPVSGLLFAVGAQYMHVDMDEGPDFGGLSTFFRAQRIF